jgi:hypothetical protein
MKPPTLVILPAVLLAFHSFAVPARSQLASQSALVPPTSQAAMQQIAAKIAQSAKKAGCGSSQCSLLVTDFYTSSEGTSRVGLRLSDEFVVLLAKEFPPGNVMSRTSLRQFVNINRISPKILKEDKAARWMGRELGATTVLLGEFNLKQGGSEAKFEILDARQMKKKGESFGSNLPDLAFDLADLQTIDPFAPREKTIKNASGETALPANRGGVSSPRCTYMPNPSYTDEARQAKFSGVITMEAIVTRQGTVEFERILHGLPFNLNDQARRIMEVWRCTPATKDGQPVPTLVLFEVNFRLY